MPKNNKQQDLVQQPLMSTATTEQGFDTNPEKEEKISKPTIGEKVVGIQQSSTSQS